MSSAGAASRRRSTEQAPPRGLGSSGGGLPDENAGWRYTLRVPSWSQAQLPDGDTAVFYQVEVTVLPPTGETRKRSVGRRFSSFITLHRRLREELGAAALRGLDPPPRRSLAAVNRKPELIEQRRWELEQWLWRLTESPEIANSVMMFHFCELDAAARVRPRASSQHPAPRTAASLDRGGSTGMSPAGSLAASAGAGALPGPDSSPLHSYAPSWSGSEASELYADSSSSSLAAVAAAAGVGVALGDSPAHPPSHLHQHTHQPRLTPPRVQAAGLHATSDTQSDGGSGQAQAMLPVGASLSGIGSGGHLRLALPVQQRGATKAAARLLREQLAVAQADLQDAARTIAADQQAIAQLAAELQQLQQLQQQQGVGGNSDAAAGSEAVAAAAAAQQETAAALEALKQKLVAAEAERNAVQAELAAAEQRQMEQQVELEAAQQRQAEQQAELEAARQRQAKQQAGEAEEREQQAEVAEERAQQLGALEAQCVRLQEQLQEAQVAAAAADADREAAALKSREDLKVLAKEVKSLRKQLVAAQQHQQQQQLAEGQPPAAAESQQQREERDTELAALRQQQEEQAAELASLRQQLAVAQAAAEAAATLQQLQEQPREQQQEQANGVTPERAAAAAVEERRQTAQLLEATAALRKVLASCGVSGSETAALGAAGMAARLAAASQQLSGLRAQVAQQLQGPDGETAGAEGSAEGGSLETQLRSLLAGLLLDAAAAKQQQHELLGRTLAVTAQLQGLEERIMSPSASPSRRSVTLPAPL